MHVWTRGMEPTSAYWIRVLFGFLFLVVCDGLWFWSMYPRVYAACFERPRRKRVRVGCLVSYAAVGALISSAVRSHDTGDAASVGAVLGFLLFFTFNVTMYGVNEAYSLFVCMMDTAYGTIAWTLLLITEHKSDAIVAWFQRI